MTQVGIGSHDFELFLDFLGEEGSEEFKKFLACDIVTQSSQQPLSMYFGLFDLAEFLVLQPKIN